MRVVTDTPVTTRSVAKAARKSGGEALSALASPPPRRATPEDRSVVHARCDGPPRGSVAPPVASLRDVGQADLRWTPWEQLGARPMRDRGPRGTFRSLLRQAARRQAITRPKLSDTAPLPLLLPGLVATLPPRVQVRTSRTRRHGSTVATALNAGKVAISGGSPGRVAVDPTGGPGWKQVQT